MASKPKSTLGPTQLSNSGVLTIAATSEDGLDFAGSAEQDFQLQLIKRITDTLWMPASKPVEQHEALINQALAALEGLAPRNEAEGMLVRELQPGVVVMDNLPGHKVAGVREAVQAAGAKIAYLSPYSPDFNRIENAFSRLKALLRKAAARTVPDLHDAIAAALDAISPAECANYSTACGYEPE